MGDAYSALAFQEILALAIAGVEIEVDVPFSLKATVLSHGWHECSPMSWCEGGRCFQIIERQGSSAFRVSVVEVAASARKMILALTADGEEVDEAMLESTIRRVRYMLGLDQDVAAFHAICTEHPVLHVIPLLGAGRLLRSASMDENIIKALCATNVNWTMAVKMINRIGQLGPPVRHFVHLNAWPTVKEIVRAGDTYLRDVCRLGYRVESVLAFCMDVAEDRRNPDGLIPLAQSSDVDSDSILAQLRDIKGIGPASAHFLLSSLGRYDCLSIDSATVAHVARTHMNGEKPTHKQIEKIYAPYGKWRDLVWWFEHWLTWGTAQRMLSDAGLSDPFKRREKRPKKRPKKKVV